MNFLIFGYSSHSNLKSTDELDYAGNVESVL